MCIERERERERERATLIGGNRLVLFDSDWNSANIKSARIPCLYL